MCQSIEKVQTSWEEDYLRGVGGHSFGTQIADGVSSEKLKDRFLKHMLLGFSVIALKNR